MKASKITSLLFRSIIYQIEIYQEHFNSTLFLRLNRVEIVVFLSLGSDIPIYNLSYSWHLDLYTDQKRTSYCVINLGNLKLQSIWGQQS